MEPSSFRFLPWLCSLLLLILLHTPASKSESSPSSRFVNCTANFTANGAFQSNLNLLLSSLPSAAAPSGFYNTTVGGNGSDQVYGLALCRGDISSADCSACLSTAARDAVAVCPGGTSNTLWYDTCMLRYSNSSFFGVVDWTQIFAWNTNNVTDPEQFDDRLYQLMGNLSTEAAYGSGRPPLFAVGQVEYTNFTNIYGLAQCTRDLSPDDCHGCLKNCIRSIPNCCANRIGGRILGENCMIRFESALFYSLPAPPPAGSGQNRGNGSSQTGGKESGDGSAASGCRKVINFMGVQTGGVISTIIILLGLMMYTAILFI